MPGDQRLKTKDAFDREQILLKLGLTGGIASGKSAVGEMFVKLGAHLIQADAVAHELMQPGRSV